MRITASDLSAEEAARVYDAIEGIELDYKLAGVYNEDKRRLNLYLTPFDPKD